MAQPGVRPTDAAPDLDQCRRAGALAARNALGLRKPKEYRTLPYTWTDWYGSRLQFVGIAASEGIEIVLGDVDSDRFLALYRLGTAWSGLSH